MHQNAIPEINQNYIDAKKNFQDLQSEFIAVLDKIKLSSIIKKFKQSDPEPPKDLITKLEQIKDDYGIKEKESDQEGGSDNECSEIKEQTLALLTGDKSIEHFYNLSQKFRESFFCIICNQQNQDFINLENMTITMSRSFCESYH